MKKLMCLVLAIALLLGSTAAFAEMPLSPEPVELSIVTMRWGAMGDSFTVNPFLVDLEAKSNVKVNWNAVSSSDWGEQKPVMLAGGIDSLPDIFMGNQTITESDIINNVEYFYPLDDLIDQHMPNLKKAFEEMPSLRQISVSADGHIYSLPTKLPKRPISRNQPVINKQWLDNLNLEVPTTIDELSAVLKAFKEQDANGNGDANDEIPYSSVGLNYAVLAPFGIMDCNETGFDIWDGEPVYWPTSDRAKEALKWAHEMYAQGIFDPEMFTQDQTMLTGKRLPEDVARVGFDYQWTSEAVFGQYKDEYIVIPAIAGPDGEQYTQGDFNGVYTISSCQAAITRHCQNPELAAQWLDQFYTGEASIQNFWGGIGIVIQANDDGTYELMDPPEGVGADAWYWDQSLRDFGPKYASPEFEAKITLNPTSGDGLKVAQNELGKDFVREAFPTMKFTVDEYDELAYLNADIGSYRTTASANFITNGGVDEGWEEYVNTLNQMGLPRLIEINKAAYDRYLGK